MRWIVLVTVLFGWASARAAESLLVNPGFESGAAVPPEGWSDFWSRAPGAGAMLLDEQVRHDGTRALKVSHQGADDWSVAQRALLPVEPGDIFTLGGWVKCENAEVFIWNEARLRGTISLGPKPYPPGMSRRK